VVKIGDLEIESTHDQGYRRSFAPQLILPEKTIEFYVLHYHHLPAHRELALLALPTVGGDLEKFSLLSHISKNLPNGPSMAGEMCSTT
jgi:hypothetical protein